MLCTRDTIYDCLLSIPYISFDGVKYYLRRIGFIHLWSFFFSLLVVVVKTSKHTSTYGSGTLANLIFETFGFGLYGVCSLSARNWPLSLFDILHFRLHVLCAHSTLIASSSRSLPSPCCYHFYFVSFTIARTNTLNEFELNDFCCRKAASCSTYSFMCIRVTYYYHYYIQNGRVVISTKQFYVWWYLRLWYLSHWQAELSFSFLAQPLSPLWMCQTHLYMCLIFIVLCLRACMFGVSLTSQPTHNYVDVST